VTPEQHARAKEVFLAACVLPAHQRSAYLDQACGEDVNLRSHVEKLLEHHTHEAETMPVAKSDETLAADSRSASSRHPIANHDRILDSGTVIANRYRIVSLLGRGGMGEVYRAQDLVLGDAVALKFLRGDLAGDQRWLELFRREVQTARSVTHPNICRVHDIHINETSGETFISMAYIDGEDLRTLMRRIGRLPMQKAIEFSRQLCVGLTAAHAHGILHRDLKPANIMIDGQGQVRITDFGLAATRAQIAENEIRAGTPAYMAPELFAGTDVSVKSDIYALGLVLFELFTGRATFTGDSFEQIARAHQRSIPPAISSLAPEVPESIENVISACLEKNPNRRPASALTVAAALPGSDTLGLAQSAGITPSPTLVAASNRQRAERNWRQMVYLGVLPLFLAAFGFLAHKAEVPIADEQTQPTAVQVARARELVKSLTQHPADQYEGYGWLSNASPYFAYPIGGRIENGQPDWTIPSEELRFWYRCSPVPLVPETALNVTFGRARIMLQDPPRSRPGMTTIVLNDRGELRGFEQVPMPGENLPAVPLSSWSAFIEAAGLDPAQLGSTASTIIPSVHHDLRLAWLPTSNATDSQPLRAAAASDDGLPVWFLIGGVNEPISGDVPTASADMRRSASVTAVLLILAIAAIGAIPLEVVS
jgi:predicted Ser/Thr protein kinase